MTIAATECVAVFPGDGTTRAFPFSFPFFAPSEILAAVRSQDRTERVLVPGTDYTVHGASREGVLTHPLSGQPLPQGAILTVYRGTPFRQNLDIVENDPFPSKLIEDEFDRMVLRDQELDETAGRTLAHPRAAPPEERLSAEEFMDIATGLASETAYASDRARGSRSLAEMEEASAEFSAGSAQVEADRACGIQAEAQSTAGWWTGAGLAPFRTGANEFAVEGARAGIFAVNRAIRIHDAETRLPVAGHVIRVLEEEGRTRALVSCAVPEIPAGIELGQPPDAAPIQGLSAIPVLTGPSRAVEGGTADFSLSRLDGIPYAEDTEFELEALSSANGTDQTALFGLAAPSPNLIRISTPAAEAETGYLIRVRARDTPLDWSPWSPFRELAVHPAEFFGDDAALLPANADYWPDLAGAAVYSRTVEQDADQASWTALCAQAAYDPSESEMDVDGFDGETLTLSLARSGLISSGGLLLVKPTDSGTCALVRVESVVESATDPETGPFTYSCTGLSGMPSSVERIWAAPSVSAARGLAGEPLQAETPLILADASDPSAPVVSVEAPLVLGPSFLNTGLTALVGGMEEERDYVSVTANEADPCLLTLGLSAPFSGTPSSLRLRSAFIAHPLAGAEFAAATGLMTVATAAVAPSGAFRSVAMALTQPSGLTAARPQGVISLWNAA